MAAFFVDLGDRDVPDVEHARRGEVARAARAGAVRPWRKPAAAARAEHTAARDELGSGGVDVLALMRALVVQDMLSRDPGPAHGALQRAVTELVQAATNARSRAEVDATRASLEAALACSGLHARREDAERAAVEPASMLPAKPGRPMRGGASARLAVMHEVLPRLWVGGWAALLNDCVALRARGVTHVVSIISAERRRLPDFVQGHYHAHVDDREAAAAEMARHFEPISAFALRALEAGGTLYVHCGAGISRAPTAAAAIIVRAHGLRAADALALVRHGRPCARPNVGFVRALREWERRCAALSAAGDRASQPLLDLSSATTYEDAVGAGCAGEPTSAAEGESAQEAAD